MITKSNQEQKELPENDHRRLGQKLGLFSFHDVAPGAPFWHPKGMVIVRELEKYIRKLQDDHGYLEISTPIMVKKKLFEKSGHWEVYKENMFQLKVEKELYALKPMNCPESTLIYGSVKRSYRDLPLRLAELGRLHRNELSGVLGGLFRVRQFTMDDAHIFCRRDQAKDELVDVIKMTQAFYKILDLPVSYGLATRPQKALGDKKMWEEAEGILARALKEAGLPFNILKGEGAFYGPKIHFDIKDSLGRVWTTGTPQIDFLMPERFKLEYTNEAGKEERPVMIHRAIFGSFERFIGILLEHFKGALPFWLSPVQVIVLSVTDDVKSYAKKISSEVLRGGWRVEVDDRNETIGKKIREAEIQKIPYILVIGKKEAESKTLAVRERGQGDLGSMSLDTFIAKIEKEKII